MSTSGHARRPLVAGNWKMNRTHLEAIRLVQALGVRLDSSTTDVVEVAVIPPATALRSVQTVVEADRLPFAWGAQDVSAHEEGSHTGDLAARMLTALGCTYVVVGHSERRADHAEDDEVVAAKAGAAQRAGLVPLVCVGESEEVRDAGEHVEHVIASLAASLDGLDASALGGADGEPARLVVAYEPVWAIGTGRTASTEQVQEMCEALRVRLADVVGDDVARATRVVYGGSVKPDNAEGVFAAPDVDGALVGGASLEAEDFAVICRAATTPDRT